MKIFLKESAHQRTKKELRDLAQKITAVTLTEAISSVTVLYNNNDMSTMTSRYPWLETWQKIYDGTPQGIQFDPVVYLSSFYVEMELDRSLLLRLDISLTKVRAIILEHFPTFVIIASPQYQEKLILLIYLPNDPNEDHIRPKIVSRTQRMQRMQRQYVQADGGPTTEQQQQPSTNSVAIMETWDFWNQHHISFWDSILISGEANITEAVVEKMPFRDEYYIVAGGNNITGLCNFDEIDEYKTIFDQVQITSDLLGIEAARAILYSEIFEVLANAGVVDPRHILLLVDTMTYHGNITGNTRHSMAKSDVGFIEKSCFESGDKCLLHAAVTNQLDDLKGVSAQVAFGLKASLGTGAFELILDNQSLVKNVVEHNFEDQEPSYRPESPVLFSDEEGWSQREDQGPCSDDEEEEEEEEFVPMY